MKRQFLVLSGLTMAAMTEPIGFREAIARALEQQPQAKAAHAAISLAEGHRDEVRAEALPQLSLQLSHLWLEASTAQLSSTLGAAVLTVPLVQPRAWANWAEATHEVGVATYQAAEVRRQVALTAGRAWISVVVANHALATRREALNTAQAHLAFTRGRLAGGAGNQLDVLRAQRELAVVQTLVEHAEASVTRAQESLGVALGLDAQATVDEQSFEEVCARDWPGELGAARPDRERLIEAAEATQREVDHAYTDYLPSVAVQAQAFAQDVPTATLPITGAGWFAQVLVSLPLYDGGRRYALEHQRRARRDQAFAQAVAAQLASEAERRTGLDAQAHAHTVLSRSKEAAQLAHLALELTQQRYHQGLGTDLDVIDALREARDADLNVAAAEDQLDLAALDVLAATGRLF